MVDRLKMQSKKSPQLLGNHHRKPPYLGFDDRTKLPVLWPSIGSKQATVGFPIRVRVR